MKSRLTILISLISLAALTYSCKPISKEKSSKRTEQVADTCACAKEVQPPPPSKNSVLASGKLKVIEQKTSYMVTLDLFVDKLIDNEGKEQQVYGVRRAKGNMHTKFDQVLHFALPIRYIKYWNDLRFFSANDGLLVGFKKNDKLVVLYKVYSYRYLHEKFGGGEIIVEAVANKKYKVI